MKAALVERYGEPPRYAEVDEPHAAGEHEQVVEVVAAALSPRVRSQAAGSHYTSTDVLPLVPGIDGVGRGPDGRLRYFLLPDTSLGAMAERTVVDVRRSVPLPAGAGAVRIAAGMNPAMSSWVALRQRIDFRPGQSVLILGAAGNAGRIAIEVAKHLGAGRVVAAARGGTARAEELRALGADAFVSLDGDRDGGDMPGGAGTRSNVPSAAGPGDLRRDSVRAQLAEAGADVDVVLDYLWGSPAAEALRAIVPARADAGHPLTWVQIGSVAGAESPIPSAALRAVRLSIVGSGQGSVDVRDIRAELEELAVVLAGGAFRVDARAVPLGDVERTWTEPAGRERLVFVP